MGGMTPVHAWAILKADGTLAVMATIPYLFATRESAERSLEVHPGDWIAVIPVLIIDNSPAAQAVREAEQRVIQGIATQLESSEGSQELWHCIREPYTALLAARREKEERK